MVGLTKPRIVAAVIAVLVIALAVIGLIVVGPTRTKADSSFGVSDGPIRYEVLTSDNGVMNRHTGNAERVTVTGPKSSADKNLREVFWWPGQTDQAVDQESCLSWDQVGVPGRGKPIQPGLAMRIAPSTGAKGVRAITITENVWADAVWLFWVDVWDTSNAQQPYTGVHRFDVSPVVGKARFDAHHRIQSTLSPPPWHLCARTEGRRFSFMVWTGDNPKPSWTDATHVFSTTLPRGWVYPGISGGYVGHLRDGQTAAFSGPSSKPIHGTS